MKKSIKKTITSIIISVLTLAVGFTLSLASFKLFDDLSVNQMRILFSIDILCLLTVGLSFYIHHENKRIKESKEIAFQKRHNTRIADNSYNYVNTIEHISEYNYVA